MKKNQEEKDKAKFFRNMNLLTQRFLEKNYVDLKQLEELALDGKVKVDTLVKIVNTVITEPYEIIQESELKKQKVCILVFRNDFRNYRIYELLKQKFEPVVSFDEGDNNFFKEFIEKVIIPNKKIYSKENYGKRTRLPRIFGCGEFSDSREPFFMEYAFRIQWPEKPPTIKKFYNRRGGNLRHIPPIMQSGTILVVGKKS